LRPEVEDQIVTFDCVGRPDANAKLCSLTSDCELRYSAFLIRSEACCLS